MKGERFSIKKRIKSFKYAGKGFTSLLKTEHNSRIHLVAAVCVVAVGLILNVSITEWCLLLLCIGAVISAEALNSAVESLADRITEENDPMIGRAKDLAAFAVLMVSIVSAIIGILIFLPKIVC